MVLVLVWILGIHILGLNESVLQSFWVSTLVVSGTAFFKSPYSVAGRLATADRKWVKKRNNESNWKLSKY
jgi:hypothetical protein